VGGGRRVRVVANRDLLPAARLIDCNTVTYSTAPLPLGKQDSKNHLPIIMLLFLVAFVVPPWFIAGAMEWTIRSPECVVLLIAWTGTWLTLAALSLGFRFFVLNQLCALHSPSFQSAPWLARRCGVEWDSSVPTRSLWWMADRPDLVSHWVVRCEPL